MKKILHFIIFGLILYSCGEESSKKDKNTNKPIENKINSKSINANQDRQKPKLINQPKGKDTIRTHIIKTHENLWLLCRKYYGNRHYSSIIAIYNEIENVRNIKIGTTIKIPPLEDILNDPKLRLKPIQHELKKILQARKLFMKHEKTLSDLRQNVEKTSPINLPIDTKNDIQVAVTLIDESMISLIKLNSDSIHAPSKTIDQLKSLSFNLNSLSLGIHDGPYKYDLDMVHQRLIHAIRNSITWAQNNYK